MWPPHQRVHVHCACGVTNLLLTWGVRQDMLKDGWTMFRSSFCQALNSKAPENFFFFLISLCDFNIIGVKNGLIGVKKINPNPLDLCIQVRLAKRTILEKRTTFCILICTVPWLDYWYDSQVPQKSLYYRILTGLYGVGWGGEGILGFGNIIPCCAFTAANKQVNRTTNILMNWLCFPPLL